MISFLFLYRPLFSSVLSSITQYHYGSNTNRQLTKNLILTPLFNFRQIFKVFRFLEVVVKSPTTNLILPRVSTVKESVTLNIKNSSKKYFFHIKFIYVMNCGRTGHKIIFQNSFKDFISLVIGALGKQAATKIPDGFENKTQNSNIGDPDQNAIYDEVVRDRKKILKIVVYRTENWAEMFAKSSCLHIKINNVYRTNLPSPHPQ